MFKIVYTRQFYWKHLCAGSFYQLEKNNANKIQHDVSVDHICAVKKKIK